MGIDSWRRGQTVQRMCLWDRLLQPQLCPVAGGAGEDI